jgi:hypothetical protein
MVMNIRSISTFALLLLPVACTERIVVDGDEFAEMDDEIDGDSTNDSSESTDTTETSDDESDTTDTVDETSETEETTDTGDPEPVCWTMNGFTWCTDEFGDMLVVTPCNGDVGPGPTTWPYECALGQSIDMTGWDDAWCGGSCWGLRNGVVMSILPECMIDSLGAVPATEWSSGCSKGEPLPMEGTSWEEWRCGANTCAARIGALWTTPMPVCTGDEWLICES